MQLIWLTRLLYVFMKLGTPTKATSKPNRYYNFFHQISALPLEISMLWAPATWTFGINGCKLMSMITEMVAYVSIFTVSAFTFERFTAICYPLRPSLHSDYKRTKIIIYCIWIVSLVPSGFWTSYLEVIPLKYYLHVHTYIHRY